ncbi:phage late control D family protein [Thiomicrorhabdus cannonii]|uniref:phage late control D family protein n=1 Tax=Thiomicrorhabdus cannonii TaxID=2748011 RepID=UPI0015B8FE26|nr:contractile injection system protein, VgrG/Pvc8 family [Thiomicrorhabdus cannonii]
MTPIFTFKVDSKDYSSRFNPFLISLRAIDLPGSTSDYIELILDDAAGKLKREDFGAKFEVSLGFEGEKPVSVGTYIFDEVTFEGHPMQMRLLASSVDFLKDLKAATSKTWSNTTLGEVVSYLARKHGYTPSISESLASKKIEQLDQTAESDLQLLNRLASSYGAVFKAVKGYMVFKPKGDGLSVSGTPLTAVTIEPTMVTRWQINDRGRPRYGAVRASYYDYNAALVKYVTVGDGDVQEELKNTYASEEQAYSHAAARLQERTMATIDGYLLLPATPKVIKGLISEGVLELVKFRANVDGRYHITRVEHTLTKNYGYQLKVEFSKQWTGYKK